MKQKIPAAGKGHVAPAQPIPAVSTQGPSWLDRGFVLFFPLILFLAMTVQTVTMSLILAGLALVLSVGKGAVVRFQSRLSLPVWGFLVFLLLCTAASVYSDFGAYAYGEFAKLLASGSVGVLLLSRGRRENSRALLWGFSAVTGVISLLCLDLAYDGLLFRMFSDLMTTLGVTSYQQVVQEVYTGARFNGIFNDANLTGSLTGLALFIGVYLVRTGKSRWESLIAAILTGISGVAFFVSMSRGAILCFAIAALVFLFLIGRGNRISLFSTLIALGVSMGIFGVMSMTWLAAGSVLGTLIALPCGLVFWLLDTFLGQKIAARLVGRGKVVAIGIAGIIVVVIGVVAFSVIRTEPFVFMEDNFLYRGVSVESGETYTLSGDWDNGSEIQVTIYGSTREQELLHETTTYYSGPLEGASFTVPEHVQRALFLFRGPAGAELRSVYLSDGTEIPMAYTLLPENITDRFQKNLFEDYSFLLRVQYLKDGWTLFTQSPLMGHGLGSTEGLLTSVQPFFYQSLYVHNHVLQVMDETGLLGLAAFLTLMLGAAWLLVRRLRTQQDDMAAALLACWMMMNLHGLMEISFSVRMFQCAAFFLVLMSVVSCGEPVEGRKGVRLLRVVGPLAAALWLIVSFALLLGSQMAQAEFQDLDTTNMTRSEFLDSMEKLDRMDAYTDQDYKVNRMVNALQEGGSLNLGVASRCARELRETGDFDACYKVAAYYYLPLQDLSGFFETVQEGLAQERSNADAWNSAFDLYGQAFAQLDESQMDAFVAGVLATMEQMDEANEYLLVPVALDEANQAFADGVATVEAEGLDALAAYTLLSVVLAEQQG